MSASSAWHVHRKKRKNKEILIASLLHSYLHAIVMRSFLLFSLSARQNLSTTSETTEERTFKRA